MIISYLKIFFRSLLKNRLYSVINISGLAIGLAAFILIATYVRNELSYDRHYDDADRIYRVVRNEYTLSPPAMVPTLKVAIPEIEYASRFVPGFNMLIEAGDNFFTEDKYYWADNELFSIFSIEMLQGNRETVLQNPGDIVISRSIARKYFGDTDPIGRVVTVSRQYEYRVAGVFDDFPSTSHFKMDIILPIERYFQISSNNAESWGSNFTYSYVKLHNNTDLEAANTKLTDIEKELTGWTPDSGIPYEQYFFFQPITEVHLHSHRRQELEQNGDIRNVIIFSSIALLILIVAGINYINLTTAISAMRHKEVGLKKAMGISSRQLVRQFLSESVLVALISTIFAVVIVFLTQSYFGNMMNREMSIAASDLPVLIPAILLLAVMVGLATGLLPSKALSSVSVISIIKGSKGREGRGGSLRNILVLAQFVVAITLIVLTLTIQKQLSYITDTDPGYDKEQVITMRLFDRSIRSKIDALKSELLLDRDIINVSTSYNLPNDITDFTRPDWFCDDPATCTPISYNPVDYNFVDLYGIEITDGRNFSLDYPSDAAGAFLINEAAVKLAGWESPIGMEISHYDGRRGNIVGVIHDFNFQSLHTDIAPLYLMLDENVYSFFSLKVNSTGIPATLDRIEEIFNRFSPGAPFNYSFFDQEFDQAYAAEKRLVSIFAFFSVLTIFLACMGLFGMSAFTIALRTKELGVRKVFGASGRLTLFLLSGHFVKPVLLANIIAWPLAFYALSRWLEGFAYRVNITVWPFLLSTVIVLLITLLTISLHSHKIARQTPAVSLRHE